MSRSINSLAFDLNIKLLLLDNASSSVLESTALFSYIIYSSSVYFKLEASYTTGSLELSNPLSTFYHET